MCLLIERKVKPRVAKRDLTVYKLVEYGEDNRVFSICQEFEYERGVLYETDIEEDKHGGFSDFTQASDYGVSELYMSRDFLATRPDLMFYGKGFHSYIRKKRIEGDGDGDVDLTIVKCTIPKGSLYMVNKSNECISNKIIIN